MRSQAAAVAFAKRQTRWMPPGMCQNFTRTSFGVGGGYGSARLAWLYAKYKHRVSRGADVPAGVPVYWLGGSRGFGHAAVSLGNGLCRSTDWPRTGSVGTARIDDISRRWGMTLVGWTRDINGTTVVPKPGPKQEVLDASYIAHAVKQKKRINHGILLKEAVAKEVGKGDMNLASPVLGSGFKKQYAKVQREYLISQGRKPKTEEMDGIPGINSLRWLGKRRGFDVKS